MMSTKALGRKWKGTVRSRPFPRWVGGALLVVGALFLVALARYQLRLAVFGASATGQVVAFDPTPGRRMMPRVQITLPSGEVLEFHGTSLRGAPLAVGAVVPVYYLPTDPTFGEIATFRRFWLGVILSSTIIVASVGAGLRILLGRHSPNSLH